MTLTIKEIDALKPKVRLYKKFDRRGLYVAVYPSGKKVFRFKFKNGIKEGLITLGTYGELKLADARDMVEKIRQKISDNQADNKPKLPSFSVPVAQNGEDFLFGDIAALWLSDHFYRLSMDYRSNVAGILDRHIFPVFKTRFLSTIQVHEWYDHLSAIQKTGLIETGVRALSIIDRIYRFAAVKGYQGIYPCPLLKGQLVAAKARPMPAPTDEFQLQSVLMRLNSGARSCEVVMLAIQCSFHWFCRPIELRGLKWSAVNTQLNCLELTTAKSHKPHLIPLTRQTQSMLEQLKMLAGDSEYIFQSPYKPNQPISENSCNNALRLVGITNDELVMHGTRATAFTLLSERFSFDSNAIRTQLGHSIRDKTERAYNRAKHLKKRIKIMKTWSQFLVELAAGKVDLTDLIGEV